MTLANPVIPSRTVFTDLYGTIVTCLGRNSLLGAQGAINLDAPSSLTLNMRSNDPAVNSIWAGSGGEPTDGDPFVAQSNRLCYLFMRLAAALPWTPEYLAANPWQCVASGIAMSPQDQATSEIGTTTLTVWDAWQLLNGIPCFLDDLGTGIDSDGLQQNAYGNVTAFQTVQNAIASLTALDLLGPLAGVLTIDLPPEYGGTEYYTGTNQMTPFLYYQIQQATSVGQLLTDLCTAGDSEQGTSNCIDIVFEPIWDPIYRPGYTCQMSVYNLAGRQRPAAPMTWATGPRTSPTANRQHDGTPAGFVNVAEFYVGQGGYPIYLPPTPPPNNAESVEKYGPYVSMQTFSDEYAQALGGAGTGSVQAFAYLTLNLQKQGKRTFTVDPDPIRGGIPFLDYYIGDRVPVLAPGGLDADGFGIPGAPSLRVSASGYQRVQTMPLVITPDGLASVQQLQVCADWPGDSVNVADLTPTSGAAGTSCTAVCQSFASSTALEVYVGGISATVTAGGTTNGLGDTTITFTVPSRPAGVYTVYVSDGSSPTVANSQFTVT